MFLVVPPGPFLWYFLTTVATIKQIRQNSYLTAQSLSKEKEQTAGMNIQSEHAPDNSVFLRFWNMVFFGWWAGELVACASGANFTPHIINVAAGEVSIMLFHLLDKIERTLYLNLLLDTRLVPFGSELGFSGIQTSSFTWTHFILISVYITTLFIYLIGCQYEDHIFLPTRSKGNLHSVCQWCDCKCYIASTGLLGWYSYLWGLSMFTSEVIYMLRTEDMYDV